MTPLNQDTLPNSFVVSPPTQRGELLPAKALIALDADINQFNASNQTPLDLARYKSPPLADLLTSIGALEAGQIMADLQYFGSYYDGGLPEEGSGDGGGSMEDDYYTLDPAVLNMDDDYVGRASVGGAGAGGGADQETSLFYDALETVDGGGLSSIPEGVLWCVMLY